jgi:protease I
MAARLNDRKVAILFTDGVEQVEFTKPRKALLDAGAQVVVVSPKKKKIKGWDRTDWGDRFDVDVHLDDADASEYDALVLPGGVLNPDQLRLNEKAVSFVKAFFEQHKPVCAICHGPQILINAGVVDGREMTSYPAIRVDLENAGAKWVDRAVVVDQGLVTSRKPEDLPAFNDRMIEEIAEGAHAGQTT